MQAPETEFARAGEARIAYQVFGSGPVQLVSCGGPASHIELMWEEPLARRWLERLASFARVAIFDRRGTGASDPADGPPTLEQYLEDLAAVMHACGFNRAALVGGGEATRVCVLFAATHPERVSALVLMGAAARGSAVLRPEVLSTLERIIDTSWGKGEMISAYAPSMAGDERFRRWAARLERNSVSPRGARQILRMASRSDVTDALPRIEAPTLVLHRRGDPLVPLAEGRAVAAAIPGARFVELEGHDSMPFVGDADALLDETEEFLTGSRATRRTERALATVLFTDIVGSTDLAARLSDRPWRDLLVGHDELVRREVERGGGRLIKTVGDGVLATFDRPGEAVRAACSIVEGVGGLGLRLRAGLHTGEIELVGDDVGGLAVHIGARIMALAQPQQICVSGTVRDILVGSGLEFDSLGTHELRGVPGSWPIYAVAPTG